MTTTCPNCTRVNPADAFYCHFDGTALANRASGPLDVARREALLQELVKIDLAYRWRAGDRRQVQDYLGEFPELLGLEGALPVPRIFSRDRRFKCRFTAAAFFRLRSWVGFS